jgi:murein DD-endopeptidase MepM/ murein hydrolase activator NlpD
MIGKWIILLASFSSASHLLAGPLAGSAPVPGGVVWLTVADATTPLPQVTYNGKPVAVIKQNQHWVAVAGLPLSSQAGHHEVRVNGKGISFQVTDKDYPEQHIQLKTRKHIDLSAEDLARHRKEKAKAKAVFKHFDTAQLPDLAFLKPVEGPYSSPFGLKRFFNGEPRNPHSGLDIAAPTGTPIKSPSPGKVVLTGDFFFNGNVVYVDHGQGVISMFCHLDSIGVKEGDQLHKGQVLGKVGATGRVTGPHLHWSVSLNNARIDPMLLLPKEN